MASLGHRDHGGTTVAAKPMVSRRWRMLAVIAAETAVTDSSNRSRPAFRTPPPQMVLWWCCPSLSPVRVGRGQRNGMAHTPCCPHERKQGWNLLCESFGLGLCQERSNSLLEACANVLLRAPLHAHTGRHISVIRLFLSSADINVDVLTLPRICLPRLQGVAAICHR